jgi:hypothetical protein
MPVLHKFFLGALLLLSLTFVRVGQAEEAKKGDAKPQPKITYQEHIQPIFREHCFTCHSQDTAKSDLALDSFGATMRGGAGGEVVLAGDLESSRLWMLVAHLETPKMPPQQDKLADAKLNLLKQWILDGALENAGSKAKIKPKLNLEMKVTSGSSKPVGPPPMPQGLFREPYVYTPRAGAVTALAASPWAPLIAVSGQKQILLYNSDTTELLGVLPFPEGVPQILKFSRNGSVLLAGGGRGGMSGRVVLYDVKTGARITEIGDELDVVLAADINDDHTLVALGGPRRIVRIYSVADGSVQGEMRKHTDWIYALEFSPDGVLLATSDRSGGMFVWEADTAREFQNLTGHTAGITDVSWRADSNVLASVSEDGSLKLWEMENGKQIKTWAAHPGGASAVEYARDGRLVSAGRDRLVKVWDQNGKQLMAFEAFADLALEVAFTHDAARVVAGDWTGELRMWNVADGKLVGRMLENPPTLDMIIQAETAKAAELRTAGAKLATELAAVQKAAEASAVAAKLATEKAAATAALVKQLEAEKIAAEKLAPQKAAAIKPARDQAAAAKTASDNATRESSNAAKRASQIATEIKTLEERLAKSQAEIDLKKADLTKADKVLADATSALAEAEKAKDDKAVAKTKRELTTAQQRVTSLKTALDSMTQKLVAAKATIEKRRADKTAADTLAAEKALAMTKAVEVAAAAKQAAQQAETDRVAASKAVVDKVAAIKAAIAQAAADKAAAEKRAAEKIAADKLLADKAAVVKAATDQLAVASAAAERAKAEKAAYEKSRTAQASAAK